MVKSSKTFSFLVFMLLVIALQAIPLDCANGKVANNSKCALCKSFANTIQVVQDQYSKNKCFCNTSYVWSQSALKCINKTAIYQTKNNSSSPSQKKEKTISKLFKATFCDNGLGLINKKDLCVSCKAFKFSSAVALDQNTCRCDENFGWWPDMQLCDCSYARNAYREYEKAYINSAKCTSCATVLNVTAKSQCYACLGGVFGYTGHGCMNCSAIPFGAGAKLNHSVYGSMYGECICQKGYSFHYLSAECICGSGSFINGTVCTACTTIKNTTQAAACNSCAIPLFFNDGSVCRLVSAIANFQPQKFVCLQGFEVKYDINTLRAVSCACSFAQGYIMNGTSCIPCSDFVDQGQFTQGDCADCPNSLGFYKGVIDCINCKTIKFATGEATSYGCTCNEGYFWNAVANQCECNWQVGYIGSVNSVCYNCNLIALYSNPASRTLCNCVYGHIFNNATKKCECDVKGSSFLIGTRCIGCAVLIGATGAVKNGTCVCLPNYVWDPVKRICGCNPVMNLYTVYNAYCLNCSAVANANGFAVSGGCACKPGFIWIPSSWTCGCPTGYVSQGPNCVKCTKALLSPSQTISGCTSCSNAEGFALQVTSKICFDCSHQKKATGTSVNNVCECQSEDLGWNPYVGGCSCSFGRNYYTELFEGSEICSIYQPYSKTICPKERGYSSWWSNNGVGSCTKCSKAEKSTKFAAAANNTGCICQVGYRWNSNQCSCSLLFGYYLNGSNCLACSLLPASGKINKTGCLKCDAAAGFLYDVINDKCYFCQGIPYTSGVATTKGCLCKAGAWDPVTFRCENYTCPSGFYFDFAQRDCVCDMKTSILDTDFLCVSCASFGNSNGIAVKENQCGCNIGYAWTFEHSIKGSCSYISTDCPEDSFLPTSGPCYPCSSVPHSNGKDPNSEACLCNEPFIWNWNAETLLGSCDCPLPTQIAVNNNNICICNPSFAITQPDGTCLDCRQISTSLGYPDTQIVDACKCKAWFFWNPELFTCECLAPFTEQTDKYQVKYCDCALPLVRDNMGDCVCNKSTSVKNLNEGCIVCSTIEYSTGRTNPANSAICECMGNLIFTWSQDGAVGTCGCPSNMVVNLDKKQCVCASQNCKIQCNSQQGFFLYRGKCLNCRLLPFTAGTSSENQKVCVPIFNKAGETYAPLFLSTLSYTCSQILPDKLYLDGLDCVPCSLAGNATQINQCNLCQSPIFGVSLSGQCVRCLGVQYGNGSVNGTCTCMKGYYFNAQLISCVCDFFQGFYFNGTHCLDCKLNSTTSAQCLACIPPFFFDNEQCVMGKQLANLNLTSKTVFTCNNGFIFKRSPINNQIVACTCPAAGQYYIDGGNCISCKSVPLQQNMLISDCQACNYEFGFYYGIDECIFCKGVKFATGKASLDGCECNTGYFWNAVSAKCECDRAFGYYPGVNGACIGCAGLPNTVLPANATGCLCKLGYMWSTKNLKCQCDVSGGSFNDTLCLTCITIKFTISKVKQKDNSCLCQLGATWSAVDRQCICDYKKGYVLISGMCLRCGYLANTFQGATLYGCTCASGFVWTAGVGCNCQNGYYRYQSECRKCGQVMVDGTTVEGCTQCNPAEGYSLKDNVCYHCLGQSEASGVSQNGCVCNTPDSHEWIPEKGGCICSGNKGYFINVVDGAVTCSLCDDTDCQSCNIYNNYYRYFRDNTCTKCSSVTGSTGLRKFYEGAYECECPPEARVNYNTYPFKCECSFKSGNFFYGELCYTCNTYTNKTVPTKAECLSCNYTGGFFYNSLTKSCHYCSQFPKATGKATPFGCICKDAQWNPITMTCTEFFCGQMTIYVPDKNKCLCNPTQYVQPPNDFGCINCKTEPRATGATLYNIETLKYQCVCQVNYVWRWTETAGLCDCALPLLSDGNGGCICDDTISVPIGTNQCVDCRQIIGSTTQTNPENKQQCGCIEGLVYKYNATTKVGTCECPPLMVLDISGVTCICDPKRTITVENLCVLCSSIPFSNNVTYAGLSCGCITPYVWEESAQNCSCPQDSFFNPLSKKCFLCNQLVFAVSKATLTSCTCQDDTLAWDFESYSCGCVGESAFIVSGNTYKCVSCDSSTNAVGRFNRTACLCLPTFVWLKDTCSCPTTGFALVDPDTEATTCVNCNASIFASGKNGTATCKCVSTLFVWMVASSVCECKNASAVGSQKGTVFSCITCNAAVASDGRATPLTCACISAEMVWSIALSRCVCVDSNSVIVGNATNGKCVVCNSQINAESKLNETACNCINPTFGWVAAGRCSCKGANDLQLNDGTGNYCLTCNASVYASKKNITTNTCTCIAGGFFWNGTFCRCGEGSALLSSMTCTTCNPKTLFDAYRCKCNETSIWDDIKKVCVVCGSTSALPKSTTEVIGGVACGCVAGYVWDVMSNGCVVSCTANNVTCMNCGKIPNVGTSKVAVIGNPSTYRNLPGGDLIASIYQQSVSNYDQLSKYACVCTTGYLWESFRKRCYSKLIIDIEM